MTLVLLWSSRLVERAELPEKVFLSPVAAISVGLIDGKPLLDLDYQEDARAEADLNIVMNQAGEFIEVQGTGEGGTFSRQDLDVLLDYAWRGIEELIEVQKSLKPD